MTFRKTISAALAAATLAGSLVATAAPAEARGGAFAAGLIGGVALGAIAVDAYRPGPVYVVERRVVRRTRCGLPRLPLLSGARANPRNGAPHAPFRRRGARDP